MAFPEIFEPLKFRTFETKNRIFRSNVSGRFDNYDGSGNQARLNWEEQFAKGGVGAIVSSFVPVSIRGRIVPNYATINCDERIPFWTAVGKAVHSHGCKFIMQLSHSGRQQDLAGVENQYRGAISSTDKTESFHGLVSHRMTEDQIWEVIGQFADGAERAQKAGLDGVELHAANGYLFTQFLSSAINDRTDKWGGPLENRARFLLEVVKAIRERVPDFHLQVKISAIEYNNALFPWEKKGNTLKDSIQVCKWLVEKEDCHVDALHISTGSMFPHPRNPMGDFPVEEAQKWYDGMLSSGVHTHRNYMFFRNRLLRPLFQYLWRRTGEPQDKVEGANAPAAHAIRKAIEGKVPVICTGGFQTGEHICQVLRNEDCDAVSIARPLIANREMVNRYFANGEEIPQNRRCTYCNKCLLNVLENPLSCYELSRFESYDDLLKEAMSIYNPPPFP